MSDETGKGGMDRRVHDRIEASLGVSWAHITDEKASELLAGGDFIEVFSLAGLAEASNQEAMERQAYTENLSMSGIKLVGDLRMSTGEVIQDGWHLAVSLEVPGSPLAVRAVAVVVWIAPAKDGKLAAGLFFEGLHKTDSEKVAHYISKKRAEKEGTSAS